MNHQFCHTLDTFSINNPVQYLGKRTENDVAFPHRRFLGNRFWRAKSLYRRDLKSHFGCVNAIEFTVDGKYILSGKSSSDHDNVHNAICPHLQYCGFVQLFGDVNLAQET